MRLQEIEEVARNLELALRKRSDSEPPDLSSLRSLNMSYKAKMTEELSNSLETSAIPRERLEEEQEVWGGGGRGGEGRGGEGRGGEGRGGEGRGREGGEERGGEGRGGEGRGGEGRGGEGRGGEGRGGEGLGREGGEGEEEGLGEGGREGQD